MTIKFKDGPLEGLTHRIQGEPDEFVKIKTQLYSNTQTLKSETVLEYQYSRKDTQGEEMRVYTYKKD